jgi:hypothetical protein
MHVRLGRSAARRGTHHILLALTLLDNRCVSLPIPTRDDIISSPVTEHAPVNGSTSGFTASDKGARTSSPIIDDPSEELERELAGTHLGQKA